MDSERKTRRGSDAVAAAPAQAKRQFRFLPTSVGPQELALAICLAVLGNSSTEAELIFNDARNHAGAFFVPKGSKLVRGRTMGEISGIDLSDRELRIGRQDQISAWLASRGRATSSSATAALEIIMRHGKAALVVADQTGDLGIVVDS